MPDGERYRMASKASQWQVASHLQSLEAGLRLSTKVDEAIWYEGWQDLQDWIKPACINGKLT